MAEGKRGRAFAVVRTSGGATEPPSSVEVPQLKGQMLKYEDLDARRSDHLPRPSRSFTVTLGMSASGNEWSLNGKLSNDPMRVRVERGETIRLVLDNRSPMWHPMHLHGHTFQLRLSDRHGPRKDTVNIRPRERLNVDVLADNPGEWMFHCHNLYHQEQGMMGALGYGPPPPHTANMGHHQQTGYHQQTGHHARGKKGRSRHPKH
jgi:FtsP/CotA-like multicopper oxidase with cupredoxin domain